MNGSTIDGAVQACSVPTEAGNNIIVVTNALGCVSAPSIPVQVIGTAVQEHDAGAPRMFPIPTAGIVTLSFPDARLRALLVCDAQGRVVYRMRSSAALVEMDLQDLTAGPYLLRGMDEAWGVRVVRE